MRFEVDEIGGGGVAGGRNREARHPAADVIGMEAVHVLVRVDALQDLLGVDLLGQRQLHQDAGDLGVGIEFIDQGQQRLFAGLGGQIMGEGGDA